jgi:hypothetical protein
VWDQSAVVNNNSYESIATVVLSSTANTVTFSSIPSTYKHLQLRTTHLSSGMNNNIMLRFNSDSGSNYSEHALVGSGSAASSYSTTSASFTTAGYTANATYPGGSICDIFEYSSTVKNKVIRAISSNEDNNTDSYITFNASAWYNTSAINRIDIIHGNIAGGKVFNTYSSFALYGIKG